MSENELRELAAEAFDLTDAARQLLAAEIARRALNIQLKETPSVEVWEHREIEIVGQYRDLPEAQLAKSTLEGAGIECFVLDDSTIRMNWFLSNLLNGVKIAVNKEDAQEAKAILEESVPAEFATDEFEQYEQPRCRYCGSVEISHVAGLDKRFALPALWAAGIPIPVPRNEWKCSDCGKQWKDTVEE